MPQTPEFSLEYQQYLPNGDVMWSHHTYDTSPPCSGPFCHMLSVYWVDLLWLDKVQVCFPEVAFNCPRLHTCLKVSPVWENVIEHKCELATR